MLSPLLLRACVSRLLARAAHSSAAPPEAHLAAFQRLLGPEGIPNPQELPDLNRDWMRKYQGRSTLALQPASTQEVSAVLAYCNRERLAVVPQAGNTGLAGGSVPLQDEVILLLRRLNRVRSFDKVSGVLVCGAGCVVDDLNAALAADGYEVPLDLGPTDRCQIGGTLSTNAGGVRLLRYGPLRGSLLGLEVVLADGTILDLLQTVRKDNTGYDLKQLFAGAEGTLGIVTVCALACAPRRAAVHAAFLAVPGFAAAQQVFVAAKRHLGETLSAFEFLDREALALTLRELPSTAHPLGESAPAPLYLLVETAGSVAQHDQEKLQAFLKDVRGAGLAADAVWAEGAATGAMWHLRKNISTALRHAGSTYKYDLSLPLGVMYDLVEATRARLAGLPAEVVSYGHFGDSNLHLNISTGTPCARVEALLEPWVYEWTAQHRGSISAEHGLGQMKRQYLRYSKPEAAVALMGSLKRLLDPNAILNPHKVLPDPLEGNPLDGAKEGKMAAATAEEPPSA